MQLSRIAFTVRLGIALASTATFSGCDNRSAQVESKLAGIEEQLKTLDKLSTETAGAQILGEFRKVQYSLQDVEHSKQVGILKDCPPLQAGNLILWDDDVYEVVLIRLHSNKDGETALAGTPVRSPYFIQAFVKFVSKTTPAK